MGHQTEMEEGVATELEEGVATEMEETETTTVQYLKKENDRNGLQPTEPQSRKVDTAGRAGSY